MEDNIFRRFFSFFYENKTLKQGVRPKDNELFFNDIRKSLG